MKITSNNEWTLHSEIPLHLNLSIIQGTLKPKQASNKSQAIHEPKSGCNIMLQKQLSPYENFQQFCQELEFRYALAAKAPSDPEVVKIMNEHSILNIMFQKQLLSNENNSVAM